MHRVPASRQRFVTAAAIAVAVGVIAATTVAARADLEHPPPRPDPSTRADPGHDDEAAPAEAADHPELFACMKPSARFSVNLKPDVELKDLVTWAMGFSCKKFLYGSGLASRTSKVTMITPGTMSGPQAWGLFEVALHSMGLTTVEKGGVLEIVESPTAKDEALAIRKAFPDGGEEVVRLLLRPQHVEVADLAAALDLLKSKNGVVSPLPRLRAVLVTDDADHVARMQPMVAELDRPGANDQIFAIPLVHVDAASVAQTIDKLLAPQAGGATTSFTPSGGGSPTAASAANGEPHMRIVADARSNALFVAGTPTDYARVKALASAIDVDTGTDSGAHLIRLKHAHAKDLAQTLNQLVTGAGASTGPSTPGGTGSTPGAAAAAARAAAESQTTGAFAPTGAVRITADEASNSLLVMASAHDAGALRALVEDMDAPVQQVYIEALVLEVEATNDQTLGVSWHGGSATGNGGLMLGGLIGSTLSSVNPSSVSSSTGFIGGTLGAILPNSASILGSTIPSYGLLLAASAHDERYDVLASPHILTVDNKLAKISVGENVPYQSTQGTALTSGQVLGATMARQDLALTLSITPHIAPVPPEVASVDREVALDIDLEDSEMPTSSSTSTTNLNPTWKSRSLVTSVVLHDEETLVLGGLVDERTDDVVDKIPILGSIPVIGQLFKQTTKTRQKTNLLVLITPHVLGDSEEGRDILARRMRERDEFVRSSADLDRRVWEAELRPEKMRGIVADIDANVRTVEREHDELEAAARPRGVKAGQIETQPVPEATPGATPDAPDVTSAPTP